ncbi:hypothetical protein BJY00DRAFT_320021, partial [Aspergillus carlsbadensis]
MAGHNKVAERWRALEKDFPVPGEEARGIYIPDNAPEGTFYIGFGKVIETGLCANASGGGGDRYIWVQPYATRGSRRSLKHLGPKGKQTAQYQLFDPDTGEDMPIEYLPALRYTLDELDQGWGGPRRGDTPLPKFDPLVRVGEEAPGSYAAPDNMIYEGVGRTRRVQRFGGRAIVAMVEPVPGKAEGIYEFQDRNNGRRLHYMDIPSVIGNDDKEEGRGGGGSENTAPPQQEQQESDDSNNPGRPAKKQAEPLGTWGSNARFQDGFPELGAEGLGSYIAPDGRIYIGVGKVVATGLNADDRIYAF